METLLWIFIVLLTIALLFLAVFALLAFDELIHGKLSSAVVRGLLHIMRRKVY